MNWCEQCAADENCVARLVCKTKGFGEGKCAQPITAGKKCSDSCKGYKNGLKCNSVDVSGKGSLARPMDSTRHECCQEYKWHG